MRLLVSGGSGFVGANLTRHFLKSGYNVISLIRKSSNTWRLDGIDKSRLYATDLNSRSEVFDTVKYLKPEIVCHTACLHPYEKDRDRIFNTNLMGTMNLLDACIAEGVRLFINTGSYFEYGDKDKALKESDPINPETDYAVSKALATQYCSYRNNSTTKTTTLRLFTPYGYYEQKQRLMPYLIYCSIKKQVAKVSSLKNLRDFVFIEDVDRAYEQVIKRSDKVPSGSVFNIGSGVQYTVGDVIKAFGGLEFKVEQEMRAKERAKKWQSDITNAIRVLAWRPKTTLEEGISKTVKWMAENIGVYED